MIALASASLHDGSGLLSRVRFDAEKPAADGCDGVQVCTSSNGDEFAADETYDAGGARVGIRITPTLAGPMKVCCATSSLRCLTRR